MDALLRGLLDQPVQQYDRFVTKQVTSHLFAEHPPHGLGTDLISLNIQRGRDHAIPGYNKWREFCGLETATSFDNLVDIAEISVRKKFKAIYSHVDDIDLFPAGIAERSVDGGLLGPTFACILGRQFDALRRGDRFWYENSGSHVGFSEDQLAELRKTSLAKVLCRNGDNISRIQSYVMELPFRESYPRQDYGRYNAQQNGLSLEWFARLWNTNYNARLDCSCLSDIDLSKWKEMQF